MSPGMVGFIWLVTLIALLLVAQTRIRALQAALLAAFSAVVLAPFAEELTYRGVLFGSLATRMSTHRAALISCLAFAGFHGYGVYGFASVALSGYLWARLAARTGTLVPGMLAHALFNAVLEAFRAL